MKSNFHSESGPGTYKKTLKCMSYENHKAFFLNTFYLIGEVQNNTVTGVHRMLLMK